MHTVDPLPITLDETNETVRSNQAERVVTLALQKSGDIPTAARELGLNAQELKAIHPEIRGRVRAVIERYGISDELQKLLVRAKLTQLMVQEEDAGLSLAAIREIKKLHGMDQVPTVQLTFTRPPEAEAAARLVEEDDPGAQAQGVET